MNGIAIIDKAEGWTSHDVVAKFRGIAKTRRVGHLGTLDPMATGVLPLAVGLATRLAKFYTRAEKLYQGGIRFGFATDTQDRTGVPLTDPKPITFGREDLEAVLEQFRGKLMQMPPQYSAKKVRGVAAYKSARLNIPVELQPVEVNISELILLQFSGERADVEVRCSGGTYIRSLAHEIGVALDCGAHLDSLRRLASADFIIEQARTLETVDLARDLIPLRDLLPEFPAFIADGNRAAFLRQGRIFEAPGFDAEHVRAMTEAGELIAICDRTTEGVYHPSLVVG